MHNNGLSQSVFVGKSQRSSIDSEVVPPFFLNGGRPLDSICEANYRVLTALSSDSHQYVFRLKG
jgi:hypothetical protein